MLLLAFGFVIGVALCASIVGVFVLMAINDVEDRWEREFPPMEAGNYQGP